MKYLFLALLIFPSLVFGYNVKDTLDVFESQGYSHKMCEKDSIYAKNGDYLILTDGYPREGMLVISENNKCVKYREGQSFNGITLGIVKARG